MRDISAWNSFDTARATEERFDARENINRETPGSNPNQRHIFQGYSMIA
jgi:hypothetical protein